MSDEPELDVEKQIAYWREGALECGKDVEHSLKGARISLAIFSAHLAIENAVKAHIVKNTKKYPPTIHNLLSLAKLAGLTLSPQQRRLFAELNPLNIEARYPGNLGKALTKVQAESIARRTKVALEWLIKQL
jgi:HEPN domain-containing protein